MVLSLSPVEISGLERALKLALTEGLGKALVISDSLSALQGVWGGEISHPYLYSLSCQLCRLEAVGAERMFCWVPSHMYIPGNRRADQAAKSALSLLSASERVPVADL